MSVHRHFVPRRTRIALAVTGPLVISAALAACSGGTSPSPTTHGTATHRTATSSTTPAGPPGWCADVAKVLTTSPTSPNAARTILAALRHAQRTDVDTQPAPLQSFIAADITAWQLTLDKPDSPAAQRADIVANTKLPGALSAAQDKCATHTGSTG